jgi:hypothetical protein
MAVLEALSEDEMYLHAILSDESGLDLAEFTWFEPANPDGCWRAWPYQVPWFRCTDSMQLDQCARALDVDTPIPTPDGWTLMGKLEPGDVVYGADGEPTVVLEVSEPQERDGFAVCFDDHVEVVAAGDHLWLTWDKAARSARSPNRRGVAQPKIRTTLEIASTLRAGVEANHAVDLAQPLAGQDDGVLVDPYVLGYWLGDGNSSNSDITTADAWVLAELGRRGLKITPRKEGTLRYGLTYQVPHNRKWESLQAHLRKIGVLGFKHIPTAYLRASETSRRQLLAGLVDSDGHMQSNGSVEIRQKSRVLANGILELLRGLGERPRMVVKRASYNGADAGEVHRITWRPRVNPALTPRKAERFTPLTTRGAHRLEQRRVVDVRHVGRRLVRCISVANDNGLFLAGDGLVVTHNSVGKSQSVAVRAFAFPFIHPGQEMVITAPERVHLDAITDKIETQLINTRLTREMIQGAIKHAPTFHVNFKNRSRIMGRIPQRDGRGVKGMHPIWLEMDECFPADAVVLTDRGQVRISEVRVGDRVLTHKNRWRAVTKTFSRGVRDAVKIRGQGHPGLVSTPDHKFWAKSGTQWKKTDQPSEWLRAGSLTGNYWASPVDVPELAIPAIPLAKTNRKRPLDPSDPAFLFLLGLWIAEGSAHSATGGGPLNRATWSIHKDEVGEVLPYFEKLGLSPQVVTLPRNGANITVHHGELARWLVDQCGKGAHNKQVPSWALGLSEEGRTAVFDGYVFGDGSHCIDERYAPGRWKLSTVSKAAAFSMRVLAQTLGYTVSVYWCDTFYQVVGTTSGQGVVDGGAIFTKVRAVTEVEPQAMYDLEVDEDHSFVIDGVIVHNSQDYPKAGWMELVETLNRGLEGAVWRAHGVTRGVRDEFYKHSQPGTGWTVHTYVAMNRPNWTDEERQEKIQKYGSKNSPDYRRNVLGAHGDRTNPLFVLHRLMRCVDQELASDYNEYEYASIRVTDEMLDDNNMDVIGLVPLPAAHKHAKYLHHWIGMDVGFTSDPSEILVFGEEKPTSRKADAPESVLRLLARIHLERVKAPEQAELIIHLLRHYRPKVFAMDSTGLGLPLFDVVQRQAPDVASLIKGYNFSEKILVGFDETVDVDEWTGDRAKEAEIRRNVKEYAQDCLRTMVDQARILLPWDRDLIGQFEGGTEQTVQTRDQYNRRRIFSSGDDHALDAARMAALGWKQYTIDEMMKAAKQEVVIDAFLL